MLMKGVQASGEVDEDGLDDAVLSYPSCLSPSSMPIFHFRSPKPGKLTMHNTRNKDGQPPRSVHTSRPPSQPTNELLSINVTRRQQGKGKASKAPKSDDEESVDSMMMDVDIGGGDGDSDEFEESAPKAKSSKTKATTQSKKAAPVKKTATGAKSRKGKNVPDVGDLSLG